MTDGVRLLLFFYEYTYIYTYFFFFDIYFSIFSFGILMS